MKAFLQLVEFMMIGIVINSLFQLFICLNMKQEAPHLQES